MALFKIPNHDALYFELTLEPDYLEAVGQVSAQWSFFENQMDMHLAGMLKNSKSEDGNSLILQFAKRTKLWKRLARESLPDKKRLETLIEIIDLSSQLRTERDKVVHGLWGDDGNGKNTSVTLYRFHGGKGKTTEHAMPLNKIEEIGREISRLNFLLMTFLYLDAGPFQGVPEQAVED